MKSILKHFFAAAIACAVITTAHAQTRTLRVVSYNIEDDVGTTTPLPGLITPSASNNVAMGGVLEGIGEEILGSDPAQPIDVLALQETTSNPTTVQPIVDGLNTFYAGQNSPARYAMSPYQARESNNNPNVGNGPNAMVYNTNTLQLLASTPVDPPNGQTLSSTSGELREVVRYEFAPAGVSAAASNEFYVYVSHYKSSASGVEATNEAERDREAIIIRNDEAANLPSDARVLYVGDYNIGVSGEASYQTMLAATSPSGIAQGQGVDLLNVSAATNIDWTKNSLLVQKTDSSTSLHFRDDLQVMTTNVFNAAPGGLCYVPGTYHAFGNNGTTLYEKSVNSGTDTALNNDLAPGSVIRASDLYQDLTTGSDHLPIVADYTVPIPPQVVTPLQFNIPQSASNGTLTLAWPTDLGRTYRLDASPDLLNWTAVATNLIGTGSNLTFITNTSGPAQFFRIFRAP